MANIKKSRVDQMFRYITGWLSIWKKDIRYIENK